MKRLLLLVGATAAVCGLALVVAALAKTGERPAHLIWSTPDVKTTLMTVGYKVYANRSVEDGRHYVSKIVFKNDGEHPVTDFSVSYKIDDYTDWTDPDARKEIPPGFSFVALYYPRLPASVSKLRNAATTSLRIRVRWNEDGNPREQTLSRDLTLRSVNEIAYCDLPQSEIVLWADNFSAAAFTMSMVTPNDPVVALYAAEITKLAGGTTAGIAGGPDEVRRICKIAYDYMCRTGLRYVGDEGIPVNYDNIVNFVQTVRLPRDVIMNNQGLCIELSILWCSILEHLGVNMAMIMVPGHAFVVAYSPEQGMPLEAGLPIECTAITPRAVGKDGPVSFDDAVKMAAGEVQHWLNDGRVIPFEVRKIQAAGFTPPELPELDMAKVGETLATRLAPEAAAAPAVLASDSAPAPLAAADSNVAPAPLDPPAPAPLPDTGGGPAPSQGAGMYSDPSGLFTVSVPAGWKADSPGAGTVEVWVNGASIILSQYQVADGRRVVDQLVQQVQSQARNFKLLYKRSGKIAGRQAWIGHYESIGPRGTPSRIIVIGIDSVGGPSYGILADVDQAAFKQLGAPVDQVVQSIRLNR